MRQLRRRRSGQGGGRERGGVRENNMIAFAAVTWHCGEENRVREGVSCRVPLAKQQWPPTPKSLMLMPSQSSTRKKSLEAPGPGNNKVL